MREKLLPNDVADKVDKESGVNEAGLSGSSPVRTVLLTGALTMLGGLVVSCGSQETNLTEGQIPIVPPASGEQSAAEGLFEAEQQGKMSSIVKIIMANIIEVDPEMISVRYNNNQWEHFLATNLTNFRNPILLTETTGYSSLLELLEDGSDPKLAERIIEKALQFYDVGQRDQQLVPVLNLNNVWIVPDPSQIYYTVKSGGVIEVHLTSDRFMTVPKDPSTNFRPWKRFVHWIQFPYRDDPSGAWSKVVQQQSLAERTESKAFELYHTTKTELANLIRTVVDLRPLILISYGIAEAMAFDNRPEVNLTRELITDDRINNDLKDRGIQYRQADSLARKGLPFLKWQWTCDPSLIENKLSGPAVGSVSEREDLSLWIDAKKIIEQQPDGALSNIYNADEWMRIKFSVEVEDFHVELGSGAAAEGAVPTSIIDITSTDERYPGAIRLFRIGNDSWQSVENADLGLTNYIKTTIIASNPREGAIPIEFEMPVLLFFENGKLVFRLDTSRLSEENWQIILAGL